MVAHARQVKGETAMQTEPQRHERIVNALWGLFIGDALAMPVHWYYNPDNILKDYPGGVSSYAAAKHPHPESFMVGMGYHPDVATAKRLGRPYDILHEHVRFYQTSYSDLAIERSEREREHGNLTPAEDERYHYHHGLAAGENTLGAQLVRVLMRCVAAEGRYDPDAFVAAFVDFLATPGRHRDPYTEIYIRRWFEAYSQGLPAHACAEQQRRSWSIGSHGGLIRPLVISLLASDAYQGLGLAVEHQMLTHRSENVVNAAGVLVPLLHALVAGQSPRETTVTFARRTRLPEIGGRELFSRYREAQGPGNIPAAEMWRLHTRLETTPMDLPHLLETTTERQLTRERLATACYPEHGLPMLLYLAVRHGYDLESALLANANAGGDNVHRGMLLGLVVGAGSRSVPPRLKAGLKDHAELNTEIDRFAALAVSGEAV
ncbi:MAG: ADP-ribosylglycohydrolase family protein [Desulfosarcinaceae bacterium]|nr:ADP-ribosylglycohydrolase family protein [Desulfosarcinaceae bacterium]